MENASKALIIAGGILLAIITLSILLYSYNNITIYQDEKEKNEMQEQITRYNAEYEGYNKKVMYGTDVISVLNKAISNNETKKIKFGNEYFVNVTVEVKNIQGLNPKTYSLSSNNDFIKNNICIYSSDSDSIFAKFKMSIFMCEGIEYNNTGRIKNIKFKQIEVKKMEELWKMPQKP